MQNEQKEQPAKKEPEGIVRPVNDDKDAIKIMTDTDDKATKEFNGALAQFQMAAKTFFKNKWLNMKLTGRMSEEEYIKLTERLGR